MFLHISYHEAIFDRFIQSYKIIILLVARHFPKFKKSVYSHVKLLKLVFEITVCNENALRVNDTYHALPA